MQYLTAIFSFHLSEKFLETGLNNFKSTFPILKYFRRSFSLRITSEIK